MLYLWYYHHFSELPDSLSCRELKRIVLLTSVPPGFDNNYLNWQNTWATVSVNSLVLLCAFGVLTCSAWTRCALWGKITTFLNGVWWTGASSANTCIYTAAKYLTQPHKNPDYPFKSWDNHHIPAPVCRVLSYTVCGVPRVVSCLMCSPRFNYFSCHRVSVKQQK